MSVVIHPTFDMAAWPEMAEFLARNYRPDLALRSRRYFEWQFCVRRPGDPACVINAWEGDRLVGIVGYVATDFLWGGATISGAWFYNWMVDAEHRRGLGFALLRDVQQRFGIVLSTGANEENARLVQRLGWAYFPALPRFLAIFDPTQAAPLLLPGASPADLGAVPLELPRIDVATSPSPTFAPDWHRYPEMAFGAVRSASFLRWRYLEHPAFTYRILVAGEDGQPAVCVYRTEVSTGEASVKVGRVVEFFHPGGAEGECLGVEVLRAAMGQMAAEGCAFADLISSGRFAHTLVKAGWSLEPDAAPKLAVRLRPVERRPFPYSLEYGVRKGLPLPDLTEVYVTKGDTDTDRPVSLADLA